MLWVSASRDACEPREDGREALRDPPRIDLTPPPASLCGDLGAVRAEKPEGGFAVRITGGEAARSSRLTSRALGSWPSGELKAPYSTPNDPMDGDFGGDAGGNGEVEGAGLRRVRSLVGDVDFGTTSKLVMRDEMTSAPVGLVEDDDCWVRRVGEA